MKVRMSSGARAYLLRERAYLQARSAPAAAAFVARMRKARESLGRFPDMGLGPERLPIPGSRRLIVGEYLMDYDIDDDLILITAISPAARPMMSLEADQDYDDDPGQDPEGFSGP